MSRGQRYRRNVAARKKAIADAASAPTVGVVTPVGPVNRFPEWNQSFTNFGSFRPGELGGRTTDTVVAPVLVTPPPVLVRSRAVVEESTPAEVPVPSIEVVAAAVDAVEPEITSACKCKCGKEASCNEEQLVTVEETDPDRWVDSKLAEEGNHGLPTPGQAVTRVFNAFWTIRRLYPALVGWGTVAFILRLLFSVEIDGKPALTQSISGWIWLYRLLPIKVQSTIYIFSCLVGVPVVIRAIVDFYREYVRKAVVAEDLEVVVKRQATELKADPELLSTMFMAVMYTRRDDRKMVELKRRAEAWMSKNRPKWSPQVKLEQASKCCLAAMCFTIADDQAQNTLSWGYVWERLNIADMSSRGIFSNGRVLPRS